MMDENRASHEAIEQVTDDLAKTHIARDDARRLQGATTSPLLSLPGEQRNSIFHHFFQDIMLAGDIDVWDDEWPDYRFNDYLSLLLVCRQVYNEASSIFEKDYLPKIMWYFAEPQSLHDFAAMTKRTNLKDLDVNFFVFGMSPKWCPVTGFDSTNAVLPWDIVHQQHVPGKLRDVRPAIWYEYSALVEADEVIEGDGYTLTGRVKEHYTIRTATVLAPDRRLQFHRGTRRLKVDRRCNDAFEALEGILQDVDWSQYSSDEGQRARDAMKARNDELDAAGGTLFNKALRDVEEATAQGIILTPAFFREKYRERQD